MCYFAPALDPKLQTNFVRGLRKFLSENKLRPKFVIGRGLSGAAMGAVVASRLRKLLILVRKPNDGSHSCNRIEGFDYHGYGRNKKNSFIVIDDLVESGGTIASILSELEKKNSDARDNCLGVFCYHQTTFVRFNPAGHADYLRDVPLYIWRGGTFEKWSWK